MKPFYRNLFIAGTVAYATRLISHILSTHSVSPQKARSQLNKFDELAVAPPEVMATGFAIQSSN